MDANRRTTRRLPRPRGPSCCACSSAPKEEGVWGWWLRVSIEKGFVEVLRPEPPSKRKPIGTSIGVMHFDRVRTPIEVLASSDTSRTRDSRTKRTSSEQRILCAKGHAHALWANHFGSLRPDALSLSLCRLARSAGSLPEKRQKAVPTDTTTDTTDAPSPKAMGRLAFSGRHTLVPVCLRGGGDRRSEDGDRYPQPALRARVSRCSGGDGQPYSLGRLTRPSTRMPTAPLRTEIEKALDELVAYEEGMRFSRSRSFSQNAAGRNSSRANGRRTWRSTLT